MKNVLSMRERAAQGLQVGDCFRIARTFGAKDVFDFARVSGDYNPVHFDARFAAEKGFRTTICHGLLTASLLTEIGGQIGWLASAMDLRFRSPVHVGDTVTCTFLISAIDANGRARATATFVRQDDVLVAEAEIRGMVPRQAERQILRQMLAEGDPTNGVRTQADGASPTCDG